MEGPERGANEQQFLTIRIIWVGLSASLFIYLFICHVLGDEVRRTVGPNFPLDLMRNILYGVAIFTLFLTHFLRKFMLTGRSAGSEPMSSESPSLSNQPLFLGKYTTAMIVSLALSESIGIYGLVLFLLGDSFQTLYIFISISALAMFFYRPKREDLETLAIAMQTKEAPAREF